MILRRKLYHYINGVRSGIPFCCVRFWVKSQAKYPDGVAATLCKERYGVGLNDVHEYEEANYVRCPKCFESGRDGRCKGNGTILHWLLQ